MSHNTAYGASAPAVVALAVDACYNRTAERYKRRTAECRAESSVEVLFESAGRSRKPSVGQEK